MSNVNNKKDFNSITSIGFINGSVGSKTLTKSLSSFNLICIKFTAKGTTGNYTSTYITIPYQLLKNRNASSDAINMTLQTGTSTYAYLRFYYLTDTSIYIDSLVFSDWYDFSMDFFGII